MSMTKIQATALAHFVHTIRDDWDFHGIRAALGINAHRGTAADLAVAMITAAASDADTPAAVVNHVYWPFVGPKADEVKQAQYRDDLERARFRRLKGEADQAAESAATAEQIAAIRYQTTTRAVMAGGTEGTT